MANIKEPKFAKSELAAREVLISQYLHELLWVDLINLKVAKLIFHIEHRTSEIILEIPKLGLFIERSGVDSEEVKGWVMSESKLDLNGAVHAITEAYPIEDRFEESLTEQFNDIYLTYLAYLSEDAIILDFNPKKRWGVSLTEEAEEVLVKHAYQYFEASEWESGVAILHPTFKQKNSWGKLDEDSKNEIIDYLLWAAKLKTQHSFLNLSAMDFLTCIALHPKTNSKQLRAISGVKNENLQTVLKLRKS